MPAILIASRLPWAAIPAVAPVLGAVGAAPAFPAIAAARGTALERAVIGALGWCWLLVGAAAAGVGSRMGLLHVPPHGWAAQTGDATSALLTPLLTPQALLGAATFALAAVLLGAILRAGHVGLALLGALLWSAGLEGALRVVAGGGLQGRPVVIFAAAVAAVILEFRSRAPRPRGRQAPVPRRSPAIQGIEPVGTS
jgi:hypothetical protein